MTLTNRLLELMKEKELNRAEVAKGAGIPYTTVVAMFENGAENTKLSTMRKLAKFFGVTLDELVYDSNDNIDTIAAHHDGEEWTEEELETIRQFKEFVKSQRHPDK